MMIAHHPDLDAGVTDRPGKLSARGAGDWLSLAAAPTFALMALLTAVLGGGPMDGLCAAAQGASPMHGMVVMYLLMSAFHLAPWLKLMSDQRRGDRHILLSRHFGEEDAPSTSSSSPGLSR